VGMLLWICSCGFGSCRKVEGRVEKPVRVKEENGDVQDGRSPANNV
jgi:hypothetical protein